MFLSLPLLALGLVLAQTATAQSSNNSTLLPVQPILRSADIKFENLAIRSNGQILTTTTLPNASIYQVDPLGILPLTLIHTIRNVTSATGIAEGEPDIFYVASGYANLQNPTQTRPQTYTITEFDVRGLSVLPDGTLTRQPTTKHIANIPGAALLNGIAFAGPNSSNLLVADTFRGLLWNVNIHTGSVSITLNNTATQGPTSPGSTNAGINGVKLHNGTIYFTNTGASALYTIPVNPDGTVSFGAVPSLVTSNLTCDDLLVDDSGTAYVAGPLDVITRVGLDGQKRVIAGTFNSTGSDLVGPTAVRFGRGPSDRWSLYATTNGGLSEVGPGSGSGSAGVSRIDLGVSL